ncbi:hypothetical protein [Streptomyces sp. NPDC090445]|uniref:hypothetical protein n=1 Tax=Streptomyces sp. NPDC090445 TaxID=3365963 RepID=UPI0037F9E842
MIGAADVGQRVVDSWGRSGVLAAYDPVWENPADKPANRRPVAVAFIRPDTGSRELIVHAGEVRQE